VATLTLASAVDNQTEGTVTVDSDVTGEEAEFDLEFFDTTIPEVTDVSVAGKDTVKFSFSEPLAVEETDSGKWVTIEDGEDVKDAFAIGGGDYYIKSVDVVNNGTEINVQTYADLDEGDLDVSLDNSLEDYAGFNVVSTEQTLDVVLDEEAPEIVDYKNASPRQVTLVFNEDVQLTDDAVAADFYHTNDNNEANDVDVDGNEVTLTFNDNNLPEGTAYVYVSGDSIVDLWGNVLETQERVELDVTVDETAPELEELKVTGEKSLELHMSEDVDVSDADLTLLDANGDEIEDAIDEVSVDSEDGSIVNVTTYDDLSGDYSLVVDGVEDLSGNDLDKVTEGFFVDDNDAPTVSGNIAKLYDVNSDQLRLVVNYPEQMAVEGQYSVDDLSKYALATVDLSSVEGASIDVTNEGSSVEIMLPKDNISVDALADGENYTLEIGRVADDSGNYTGFTNTVTVSGEGNVGLANFANTTTPKVWAPDTETVKAELDTRLVDFNKNDFVIKKTDGSTVTPSKVNTSLSSAGNTVVTFEFADGTLPHDLSSGRNDGTQEQWTLTTQANASDLDSENQYGEKLATASSFGNVTIQDQINPELDLADVDGDGDIDDADITQTGVDTFSVNFTEEMNYTVNDDLAASDFEVFAGSDKLVAGSDYTVASNDQDDVLEITLTGSAGYTGTLDIATVDAPTYITDIEGNTLSSFGKVEVDVIDYDNTDLSSTSAVTVNNTDKFVRDAADNLEVGTTTVASLESYLVAPEGGSLQVVDNAGAEKGDADTLAADDEVVVTAADGSTATYTIYFSSNADVTATGTEVVVDNTNLNITDSEGSNDVEAGTTTVSELLGYVSAPEQGSLTVLDASGTEKTTGTIAADDVVQLTTEDSTVVEYSIVTGE